MATKVKRDRVAWNKGLKGTHFSPSTEFKPGFRPSPDTEFKKGPEESHPRWKGDKVGYTALHDWVRKHKGYPSVCENCNKKNLFGMKIHWANVSGLYFRDLSDWIRLCVPCHSNFDRSRKIS